MIIINKINTCLNFTVGRTGYFIQGICSHITTDTAASALSWFQNKTSQASCHFLVCKNGDIIQLVSENNQSWCQYKHLL